MRRYQPVLHGLLTGLLQLTEVADYWPSSFFLLKIERNGGLKKDQGQHPAMLTEQAWSMNNLSCGFRRNFFLRDAVVSPDRTRWVIYSVPRGIDRGPYKTRKNERGQYLAILTEQSIKQLISPS